MKILHTSDWHLGQKFIYNDRDEEHRLALNWLIELIKKEAIDCLLVAGDIFDITNPPNYARQLYYYFLTQLQQTQCRHIIIIGGNHDSPSMLNAPKDLLRFLNVHVVGCVPEELSEELIILKDQKGNPEAVIAAVPFLRDRDLRYSQSGESSLERIEQIKQGIRDHYEEMGALAKPFEAQDIPIIATGHLFAKGATAAEDQANIYIGNMDNIDAAHFPDIFDYIALGHLHRAQLVGRQNHIRYSGSLIPLSFKEAQEDKKVLILNFEGQQLKEGIREVTVPVFRKLITITGTFEEVKKELELLNTQQSDPESLVPWLEIMVETDQLIPNLNALLMEMTQDWHLDILKIRTNLQTTLDTLKTEKESLDDLTELEVFRKKCEVSGKLPDDMDELEATFRELQTWLIEKQEE